MRDADPETDLLITHVIEALEQVCQEANLGFISGGIAGMAAFGAVSDVTGSVSGKERFTEARSRRDDSNSTPPAPPAPALRC